MKKQTERLDIGDGVRLRNGCTCDPVMTVVDISIQGTVKVAWFYGKESHSETYPETALKLAE